MAKSKKVAVVPLTMAQQAAADHRAQVEWHEYCCECMEDDLAEEALERANSLLSKARSAAHAQVAAVLLTRALMRRYADA